MKGKNFLRNEKGITLIALVITIIILLILAGISIASLTGSGLFERAKESKKEALKAEAKEKIQLEVLASFNGDKILDLGILKDNIDKNIPEAIVMGDEFPITVILNGFSFTVDSNGNVEIAGPRPIVDKTSIVIVQEDGSEIPEGGVDEGTKLKIIFTASIEGGKITNVAPGSLQDGEITYVTDGIEKEVTFTITGEVDGEKYPPVKYTISLKEYYKKTEFSSEDIKNSATSFYGSEVVGYSCESAGVSKWRIYYADDTNIYLISDFYIHASYTPSSPSGYGIGYSDYNLNFENVYKDPIYGEGSAWINGKTDGKDNSLAKRWLNKYLSQYPNNQNVNIKAVAYLMDTKIWNVFANSDLAEYAIGSPTIELFSASYRDTHPDKYIEYRVHPENEGYEMKWNDQDNSSYSVSIDNVGWDEFNYIYMLRDGSYPRTFLASPCADSQKNIMAVWSGSIMQVAIPAWSSSHYGGLRPIVCLKSGTQLKKKVDETTKEVKFEIINEK